MNRDDPKPGPEGLQRQRRVGLERKVSLKFKDFKGFITEYSDNISTGGMFIRTTEPKEPGSIFDFELRLGEEYTLIHGLGEVVWVRHADEGFDRPAGMGIRFLKLDEEGRELVDRIVADRLDRQVAARQAEAEPDSAREGREDWGMMGDWQEKRLGTPAHPEAPAPTPPEPSPEVSAAAAPAPAREPETPEPEPGPAEVPDPSAHHAGGEDEHAADLGRERSGPSPYARSFHGVGAGAGAGGAVRRRASPRPRRGLMIALLAAVLAVAAVAAYLVLSPDAGIRWFLGAEGEPAAVRSQAGTASEIPAGGASVEEPEETGERPGEGEAAADTGSAPGPEDAAGEVVAPPSPAASTDAEPTPGTEPRPTPSARASSETGQPAPADAEPPARAEPFTRVQNITWTDTAAGTEVTIHLDGTVREWDYANLRLDAAPPRHLVRILGVEGPFPRPAIPVDDDLLRRIRIGYHPKAGGNELHVVLDLADPDVVVEGTEAAGREIRLFLSREAGT